MSDADEDTKVATILEVMGDLDPQTIRRFLRQNNGNAENALNVSLSTCGPASVTSLWST